MSQAGNHLNFVVQDVNGQQQIIKILPRNSTGRTFTATGVKTVLNQSTGSHQSNQYHQEQIGTPQIQKVNVISGPTKTIKLTPSQLSALKMSQAATTSNSQRILNVSNSAPAKVTKRTPTTSAGTTANSQPRRRKTDKVGKGLRHFSMKVCEKVKEKGITTYNEVADELVQEEIEGQADAMNYDQKNIRRRVYDALNVLMAMNIISKDKKEIRWIGLPTNSIQQCKTLELENQKSRERIEEKEQQLRSLIFKHVAFKMLVTRNKEEEERGIVPTPSSAIQLPFITVNTHKKTHINCSISNDKSEYYFKFEDTFVVHDDVDVLERMGLLLGLNKGECSNADKEKIKAILPERYHDYIEMYANGKDESLIDECGMSYGSNKDEDDLVIPKEEYEPEGEEDYLIESDSDID